VVGEALVSVPCSVSDEPLALTSVPVSSPSGLMLLSVVVILAAEAV
jgi:hypothetical protein